MNRYKFDLKKETVGKWPACLFFVPGIVKSKHISYYVVGTRKYVVRTSR